MLLECTVNKFNGAVRECLEECYESRNWLATLANYMDRLRADGWSQPEVEEIETVIRRILKGIVEGDEAIEKTGRPMTAGSC
jgi:hypothetical protein